MVSHEDERGMMMSSFIKELIKKRIKQLTFEDLLHYSQQYGFSLSLEEAKHIVTYLQTHPFDPFISTDRLFMFQKISEITDIQTAYKAEALFNDMIKAYGLSHLFND